jgi:hypothetical protein
LPASETWIQRGGVRKLDSSFSALRIVGESLPQRRRKIIPRRAMPALPKHSVTSTRTSPP